jgi:hypothetical protein
VSTTPELAVAGVTCSNRAGDSRMGLPGLPEVTVVDVEFDIGRVRLTGKRPDLDRIGRQLTWLGFPPTGEEDDDADR